MQSSAFEREGRPRQRNELAFEAARQFCREGENLLIGTVIKLDALDLDLTIPTQERDPGDIPALELALPFEARPRARARFMDKGDRVVYRAGGIEKCRTPTGPTIGPLATDVTSATSSVKADAKLLGSAAR